jgi:hypothetical protein
MTIATDTYAMDERGRQVIPKDPDANLDYSTDWSKWLALIPDDPLASHSVSLAAGASISKGAVTELDGVISVFIEGGRVGALEPVTFSVRTEAGRADDRTIYLQIVDR